LRYQEHMRLAAGLPENISKVTDDFITEIHSSLIAAGRKKRNKVTPGGSTSPLNQYADALCFHYERLHPVWRAAKSIFKEQRSVKDGRQTIIKEFRQLGDGERWTTKPELIGLPLKLVNKLAKGEPYISSAEYLAYEHAAFLCGFEIGKYSVKQIKRIVGGHKKMMGAEYYDSRFKNRSPSPLSGRNAARRLKSGRKKPNQRQQPSGHFEPTLE
jgi:hypothetical protein